MIYAPIPEKKCRFCKEVKCILDFYRNKGYPDGRSHQCKVCQNAYNKKYAEDHPEQARQIKQNYKRRNPQKIKAYNHARYLRIKPDYNAARRQRYATQTREREVTLGKAYRETPKGQGVRRDAARNRRARKLAAEGKHTFGQELEQLARQKNKCYYCGKKLKDEKWHADHVVPLSRNGSDDIANIVIACPKCNQRKNDKLPHEWTEGGRLL